mmetsp:Transcript_58100/g.173399  ORF Transcript_58100/g.173399 Transcript_58100/m.173399 type:complete len:204 (-) Transcript_58100:368-979(-)|eukprot:CAMPEP_0113527462 /NCGR_PEP_ID=MMETSP0015_2-20120614/1308_1 /TAXON_ID=2838 /ORGANISM="Odontella" /LENGTH=203 /DNA_ID=CAMNT_0000425897 /DNA_START=336 /DNA_END=947 /DNA_ORIENTATION=+ /assembly_acc=CAM_ASM_000160
MDFNYNSPFRSDYGRKSKFTLASRLSEWLSPSNPVDDLLKMRRFAKTVLASSGFFWSWAVYNTFMMKSGFDLGIASFAVSAASSAYLISRRGEELTRLVRFFVLLSHLVVAANYALGSLFAFTVGKVIYIRFAVYCVTFTLLWLFTAFAGWKLISTNIAEIEEGDYEEDETEDMRYGFATPAYDDEDRESGRKGDSYSSYPYL